MRILLRFLIVAAFAAGSIVQAQTTAPSPSPTPGADASPSPGKHRAKKKATPAPVTTAATADASPSPTPKIHKKKTTAPTAAASPAAASSPAPSASPAPAKHGLFGILGGTPSASPSPAPAQGTTAATKTKKTPVAASKITAAPGGGNGLVWVNTKSHVYHKEGSEWYGKTKQGKYMSLQDAIKEGDKDAGKN